MIVRWIVVIFPLLWNFSIACEPNQTCNVDLEDENIKNLITSIENFTAKLTSFLLIDEQVKPNVMCSPMSIYASLALVLFGAAENTRAELIKALEFPDADLQQLQTSFSHILNALNVKRTITENSQEIIVEEVRVAEGIFIQNGYTILQEYSNFLGELQNVEIHPVDFANQLQNANNMISDWIQRNTPPSNSAAASSYASQTTKLFLGNILFFSANWVNSLFLEENTITGDFDGLYGLNNVPMMTTTKKLLHYDDKESCSVIQLPYVGEDFTLMIILPISKETSVDFVKNFTADKYRDIVNKSEKKAVNCQIPKLSYAWAMNIVEKLRVGLEINELFDQANLSNMITSPNHEKFGAQITHSASMALDEKGTTAMGLTTIQLVGSSPLPENPIDFIANRPFIASIRHVHTNIVVFSTFIRQV